jgi:hypothetical protein
VNTMKIIINSSTPDILNTLAQDFNGNSIYGVEFILEDLYESNKKELFKKESDNFDWFGLSDLCI